MERVQLDQVREAAVVRLEARGGERDGTRRSHFLYGLERLARLARMQEIEDPADVGAPRKRRGRAALEPPAKQPERVPVAELPRRLHPALGDLVDGARRARGSRRRGSAARRRAEQRGKEVPSGLAGRAQPRQVAERQSDRGLEVPEVAQALEPHRAEAGVSGALRDFDVDQGERLRPVPVEDKVGEHSVRRAVVDILREVVQPVGLVQLRVQLLKHCKVVLRLELLVGQAGRLPALQKLKVKERARKRLAAPRRPDHGLEGHRADKLLYFADFHAFGIRLELGHPLRRDKHGLPLRPLPKPIDNVEDALNAQLGGVRRRQPFHRLHAVPLAEHKVHLLPHLCHLLGQPVAHNAAREQGDQEKLRLVVAEHAARVEDGCLGDGPHLADRLHPLDQARGPPLEPCRVRYL